MTHLTISLIVALHILIAVMYMAVAAVRISIIQTRQAWQIHMMVKEIRTIK